MWKEVSRSYYTGPPGSIVVHGSYTGKGWRSEPNYNRVAEQLTMTDSLSSNKSVQTAFDKPHGLCYHSSIFTPQPEVCTTAFVERPMATLPGRVPPSKRRQIVRCLADRPRTGLPPAATPLRYALTTSTSHACAYCAIRIRPRPSQLFPSGFVTSIECCPTVCRSTRI